MTLAHPQHRRAPATRSSRPTASTAAPTTSSRTRCRSWASTSTFVDPDDPESFRRAITAEDQGCSTRETIGNPKLDVLGHRGRRGDRPRGRHAADHRQHGRALRTSCRPIEHGADIVVHSATKFIGGHGTSIGGVIVDSGKFDWAQTASSPSSPSRTRATTASSSGRVRNRSATSRSSSRRACSCCATSARRLSPFNAFLFLQGLETLPLRMERHSRERAGGGASSSQEHPAVTWVNYPGLPRPPDARAAPQVPAERAVGGDPGLRHQGRPRGGPKFIDAVKLLSHLANIGDAKSLVIHPATHDAPAAHRRGAGRPPA